jgi:hypothetical protein
MKTTTAKSPWLTRKALLFYDPAFLKLPARLSFTFILLLTAFNSGAQSVSPSTLNISGQSAAFGNYSFEWSVGEAASVATLSNSSLVVTTGVLQPYVSNQPVIRNLAGLWLPDEIRVYPNPTRDFIEINILHRFKGKNKLTLMDADGRKVMETEFIYNGNGRIERWDLSKLIIGQYFLYIQQVSPVTGKVVKRGAFTILKIN